MPLEIRQAMAGDAPGIAQVKQAVWPHDDTADLLTLNRVILQALSASNRVTFVSVARLTAIAGGAWIINSPYPLTPNPSVRTSSPHASGARGDGSFHSPLPTFGEGLGVGFNATA